MCDFDDNLPDLLESHSKDLTSSTRDPSSSPSGQFFLFLFLIQIIKFVTAYLQWEELGSSFSMWKACFSVCSVAFQYLQIFEM